MLKNINLGRFNLYFRENTSDIYIFNEIINMKTYKIPENMKLNGLIDIGAHIGIFSLYFLNLFPETKIFAFEPSPDNYNMLQLNLSVNNLQQKVIAYEAGLYTGIGIKYLKPTPWHHNDMIYKINPHPESSDLRVPIAVLDFNCIKKLSENCDCLKMDIEGAEWDILPLVEDKLLEDFKVILMECHKNTGEAQLFIDRLKILGFKVSYEGSLTEGTVISAFKEIKRENIKIEEPVKLVRETNEEVKGSDDKSE